MASSEERYDLRHKRILELKEEMGSQFWALGAELTSMQRECGDCGHVPLGKSFKGLHANAQCPRCFGMGLGLFRLHHPRFEDYLRVAGIHRQTAYRKIGVYETFEPRIDVISQMAPSNLWSDVDATGQELRHDWARRYLSQIGWTILETVQKQINEESDDRKILKIIEEASATSRKRAKQKNLNYPHKELLISLKKDFKEVENCLKSEEIECARKWLKTLTTDARLATQQLINSGSIRA